MGSQWSICLVLLLACQRWRVARSQSNLLQNPSFEDDLRGTWRSNGFTMERYRGDVLRGAYSLRCRARRRDLDGPIQRNIPLVKGGHYVFEGYAKLLGDERGTLWQNIKVTLQMDFKDRSPKQTYIIAYRGFVTASKGWIHLKGSIDVPMKDMVDPLLAIRGPAAGLSFLLDNLTLYELPEDPDWSARAHSNIETHRKSSVTFNVVLPPSLKLDQTSVEIALKKHRFVFGAKIEEYDLTAAEPMNQYSRIVYNLFNWATVQAYKWKFNKGTLARPDFSRATDGTDALLANGVKVRGHSILWNHEKNVPKEVIDLRDGEVRPAIDRHIRYMMNLTKGKLGQLDVQNEHIHEHYYEERLQDPNITKNAFRLVKALDPDGPVLYLNDFTCIISGANTEDMYDLAMEYQAEGVPIEGLGCQGHTKEFVKPDPTSMWRRIDRLAETGLDLMMTEFDLGWPDVAERADWLEDALRAFFGHPAMTGVILWGFWNETLNEPDHELLVGPNTDHLQFLEPGERFACLTKKEWTTKVTKNLKDSGARFSLRAFQGDYEVMVRNKGVVVHRQLFSLDQQNRTVNINVALNRAPIVVAPEEDLVPNCVSHRAERTVGTATTSSTASTLSCRTVVSGRSGPRENDATSVTCGPDEVMTGCSSEHLAEESEAASDQVNMRLQVSSWARNGEAMEADESGQVVCTAYNGRVSAQGVRAYGRCCRAAGLRCQYRTAGPSLIFDGAMAEARCAAGQNALGCSSYQPYPDTEGVRPGEELHSCVGQSGAPSTLDPAQRSGVTAFAACCSATSSLDCRVVASKAAVPRARKFVDAVCPPGYQMTGCNGYAEGGRSAGSKILVPSNTKVVTCRTTMGDNLPTGAQGVKSYATCCKLNP